MDKVRAPKGRPVTETLLTTSQVAAMRGCLVRTVQSAIYSGRLPATRLGKSWIIKRADAEAWKKKAGSPRPGRKKTEPPGS